MQTRFVSTSFVALMMFGLLWTTDARANDCNYEAVCIHADQIKNLGKDLRCEFKDTMRGSGVFLKLQVRIVRLKSHARRLARKAKSGRVCNWHKHVTSINQMLCEMDALVQHATLCAAQDPECSLGCTQCIQGLINEGYVLVQFLMADTCMTGATLRVPFSDPIISSPYIYPEDQGLPTIAPGLAPTLIQPLYKPVVPNQIAPTPEGSNIPLTAPNTLEPTPVVPTTGPRPSSVLEPTLGTTTFSNAPILEAPLAPTRYQGSIRAATYSEVAQISDRKRKRHDSTSRKKKRQK